MKNASKLLALLLVLTLAIFALASCNIGDGEQKPDDGEQKPDDGEQKPDDGEQKPDDGEQKPDDGENTTQEGEKIGWLARIIRAIAEFFKKIFGSLFG